MITRFVILILFFVPTFIVGTEIDKNTETLNLSNKNHSQKKTAQDYLALAHAKLNNLQTDSTNDSTPNPYRPNIYKEIFKSESIIDLTSKAKELGSFAEIVEATLLETDYLIYCSKIMYNNHLSTIDTNNVKFINWSHELYYRKKPCDIMEKADSLIIKSLQDINKNVSHPEREKLQKVVKQKAFQIRRQYFIFQFEYIKLLNEYTKFLKKHLNFKLFDEISKGLTEMKSLEKDNLKEFEELNKMMKLIRSNIDTLNLKDLMK